jgi:hypothetical protein
MTLKLLEMITNRFTLREKVGFAPERYNILDDLALKYGTDKGSKPARNLSAKNYTKYYHSHFREIREQKLCILEIGVRFGASIRMWEDYFENSKIFAIDIDEKCMKYESDRTKIFIGDQADRNFLDDVIAKIGRSIDIAIDDGGHRMEHHRASLDTVWPHISAGGWYGIEDSHTCYSEEFGGGYLSPDSTIETRVKPAIDLINRPKVSELKLERLESLHVYPSLAIFCKRA